MKIEDRVKIHTIKWIEWNEDGELIVSEPVEFIGLTPDAESQLDFSELRPIYRHRVRKAWETYIIEKVFEGKYDEEHYRRRREAGGVYYPPITYTLTELGLYKKGFDSHPKSWNLRNNWFGGEDYDACSFSLKADGKWKSYAFIQDLDDHFDEIVL